MSESQRTQKTREDISGQPTHAHASVLAQPAPARAQSAPAPRPDQATRPQIPPSVKQELDAITKIIADTVPVETIYLFGSYVNGTPHKDSDLDLYVVFKDELPMRELDAIFAIRTAIAPVQNTPVDILGLKQNRFLARSVIPSLERVITREGVKLYGP